ncbi:MAG: helix-turn-helix domain-containing protein [Ardenticatenaceae bacterium]|nr:helix-turn-helix domain-containing protein [Ardenticatenaceae bacterium]
MTSREVFARQVGKRIAAARRAAGLSQAELAARLAWPRDTLIHYEHGRRALSVAKLAEVAAALEVSPALFVVEDTAVADLLAQFARDPTLIQQVQFFLRMLEVGPDAAPPGAF